MYMYIYIYIRLLQGVCLCVSIYIYIYIGLLQGVCIDAKVPTVPVSKSHRFRSQLQNTFSCSLRTAAVATFLTLVVFVYAAHSPSTRDLLLTTPEVLTFFFHSTLESDFAYVVNILFVYVCTYVVNILGH
jgi:hypothetical protein